MAKAGFCSECGSDVWLLEDGRCQNGHPAASVSNVFESNPVASPVGYSPPAPSSRKWIWAVVAGSSVALLVAGLSLFWAFGVLLPLSSGGGAPPVELQARVAKDYPGWKVTAATVEPSAGDDGPQTEYTFTVLPPGGDFPVGVIYTARGSAPAVSEDEVLRPGGRLHAWSASLFDYLKHNYVDKNMRVVAVTSDTEGSVVVHWAEVDSSRPAGLRSSSFDGLWYDEDTGNWLDSSK